MPRTSTKQNTRTPSVDPCEAFVKLCAEKISGPFDRTHVAAVVGNRTVKTLADVAWAFGVGAGTPRKEWRPSGMPGEANKWNLVDITIWRLERAWKEAERQAETVSPANKRVSEIELRLLELNLAKKEREELEAAGRNVDVFLARAELTSHFTVSRKYILGFPRKLKPLLPKENEEYLSRLLVGEAKLILTQMASISPRVLRKLTSEHYTKIMERLDDIERQDATD